MEPRVCKGFGICLRHRPDKSPEKLIPFDVQSGAIIGTWKMLMIVLWFLLQNISRGAAGRSLGHDTPLHDERDFSRPQVYAHVRDDNSRNVGGLSNYFAKLLASRTYNQVRDSSKKVLLLSDQNITKYGRSPTNADDTHKFPKRYTRESSNRNGCVEPQMSLRGREASEIFEENSRVWYDKINLVATKLI